MPHDPSAASKGLSETEARARLQRDGLNRLPPPEHKSFAAAIVSVAVQPMVLLLLVCTLLYALLGHLFDSVALSLSILAVAGISVYQELRTQRVLEALRDLASPRSTVVRDGVVKKISSHEIVEGDRLIVQEGDRLACDATLIEAHSMRVDASLLTGESMPVDKHAGASGDSGSLHAGTLVVQGDGVAVVTATGTRTTLGKIGKSLAALAPRESRLHLELKRLVRAVAMMALLTCVLAAMVFSWQQGSWTTGLLVGLTLAMSIVPEEFAVVWTVMLALGAWRLARLQVLTRQPQAIEALGAISVLCVDKTGTLTCNRMEIAGLLAGAESPFERKPGDDLPGPLTGLLSAAALASVSDGPDPMDQAIFRLLPGGTGCLAGLSLQRREGVMPGRPFVLQRWRTEGEALHRVAIKGAPEAVLARCAATPAQLQALSAQAQAWAVRGMRVIAVASAHCSEEAAVPEAGYDAIGLLAFQDPLRADVPAAMAACRAAGVRVIIITGDAPATALAIAREAGLVHDVADASVRLTGAEIDRMNEAEFEGRVGQVAVFARVTPAQKLRIVQALQRRGEVVGMTGDGVNDGPALRAADVGVAMGERGTDVAREAASIVLLDDRFASLVDAVRAGRRIFSNLQHAVGYLLAVHVPIVGLSLLPLLGGPVLLLPLHVVLFELIIDPACSLVFEAEPAAATAMSVPPRGAETRLIGPSALARALGVGAVALLAVVVVQWAGHMAQLSDEGLRMAGIATIVVGNLAMLQWFRGGRHAVRRGNRVFHALLLGVCLLSLLVLLTPTVASLFGLPVLDPRAVLAVLFAPVVWALWRLVREGRQAAVQPAA
jgi:Ca2+-transporting ATPase